MRSIMLIPGQNPLRESDISRFGYAYVYLCSLFSAEPLARSNPAAWGDIPVSSEPARKSEPEQCQTDKLFGMDLTEQRKNLKVKLWKISESFTPGNGLRLFPANPTLFPALYPQLFQFRIERLNACNVTF
jgi:hypothetical protein